MRINKQAPIVLVHGWGTGSTKLKALKVELEARGFEILNVRLPGFDLPDPSEDWGVPEYSNYVYDQIPEDWKSRGFAYFGHSFGGRLGIYLAGMQKSGLRKLVLCAPGGIVRESDLKLVIFKNLSKIGKKVFGDNLHLKKIIYRLAGAGDYNRASRPMKKILRRVISFNLWDYVRLIDIPTLILWGSNDKVVPVSGAYRLHKQLGLLSKLEVSKGADHLLPYKNPVWLANMISEWL